MVINTPYKFDQFRRRYCQLLRLDAHQKRALRVMYDDDYTAEQQAKAKIEWEAVMDEICSMLDLIEEETGITSDHVLIVGAALDLLLANPGEDE